MNCSECKAPIPDHLLICEACLQRRSEAAMRDFQRERLGQCLRMRTALRTRLERGTRHIQMIGYQHSFCGVVLSPGARRGWLFLDSDRSGCCQACSDALQALIAEAAAA